MKGSSRGKRQKEAGRRSAVGSTGRAILVGLSIFLLAAGLTPSPIEAQVTCGRGARSHGSFNGRFVAYSWVTGAELLSRTGPESSSFGKAVGGGWDLDGDGTPDILVAAPSGDGGGEVYLYSGVPEP